jgi:DNA-binding beta-propeller fold protein YncE
MPYSVACSQCGKYILVSHYSANQKPLCAMCRAALGFEDKPPDESNTGVKTDPTKAAPRPTAKGRAAESGKVRRPRRHTPAVVLASIMAGGGLAVLAVAGLVLALVWKSPDGAAARRDTSPLPPPGPRPGEVTLVPIAPPTGRSKDTGGDKPKTALPLKASLPPGPSAIRSVAFDPDGDTLVTASGRGQMSGEVRFWRPTGEPLMPVVTPGTELFGAAFSPNSQFVACASGDNTVRVYDRQGMQKISYTHHSFVRGLAFSPDGNTLASACEKAVQAWDVAKGKPAWSAPTASGLVGKRVPTRLAFSPDSKVVAAGNGGPDVGVLDRGTGKPHYLLKGHRDTVVCTAFSPDGKYLVSGGFDKSIKVWDPRSRKEVRTFSGHTDCVYCVAVAPDNRTMASAAREGAVILWDLPTGKRILDLTAHSEEGVFCVAFSPDGKTLASSGVDGTVKLWDVSQVVGAR